MLTIFGGIVVGEKKLDKIINLLNIAVCSGP